MGCEYVLECSGYKNDMIWADLLAFIAILGTAWLLQLFLNGELLYFHQSNYFDHIVFIIL